MEVDMDGAVIALVEALPPLVSGTSMLSEVERNWSQVAIAFALSPVALYLECSDFVRDGDFDACAK